MLAVSISGACCINVVRLSYPQNLPAVSSRTCAPSMASQKAAKRDEIASHTLRMVKEHYSGKLRLSDVKEMFVQMKDHA